MLTWIKPRATPIGAWRRILILAEEAIEIAGIAKAETIADLLDWQIELPQPHTGFVDQALMHDGARAVAFLALAVRVQLVVSDAECSRMACDGPAVAIMQFDHLQEIADEARTVAALCSIVGGFLEIHRAPEVGAQQQHMRR